MQTLFRACLTVSMIAVALPAMAQSVTAFDGTYAGVSQTANGVKNCVATTPVPRTLTIKNGAVQWAAGMTGDIFYQGTVTGPANVNAKGSNGAVFFGKIEGGKLTGSSSSAGSCMLSWVWQKQ
jgi:hypothetical protein